MTEQKNLEGEQPTEQTKRETFAQAAAEYEPKKTYLISDLDFFTIDEPVEVRVGNKGKEDEFTYKALIRDGKEYRIPWGVFEEVQNLQESRAEKNQTPFKAFQVIKSGKGREGTKYQTIPHVSGA